MPVKQISFYKQGFSAGEAGNKLVIEAGTKHLACLVKDNNGDGLAAFELYTFHTGEAEDFEGLLDAIAAQSNLLTSVHPAADLFINNDLSVLVPSYKFNKEISEDYLRIAFGDESTFLKAFDSIDTDPVIMNVYRLPVDWHQVLERRFKIDRLRHTYTTIISHAFHQATGGEKLYVQFYHSCVIVCAIIDDKLQLIRSIEFDTPDDILYHLLNIAHQLPFTGNNLTLHLSGMIDLQSNLYKELVKYFEQVHSEELGNIQGDNTSAQHPAHYFTPFCKLVL